MSIRSAGLLIYRWSAEELEVLLAHPGGPFWARKDDGAWSIPKGLIEPGEDELAAAIRETREELGVDVEGTFLSLGEYRQPSGKIVVVWSVNADPILSMDTLRSSEFQMEWPPKSGRLQTFPEIDRAGWFSIERAEVKLLNGQRPMLSDLSRQLAEKAG